VAHGFQTLADDCEVLYQMTELHAPALAAGVRWNDPSFGIPWPIASDIVIAQRDAAYPGFDRHGFEVELSKRTAQSSGKV
jgi:dTDP-4-dehydrorhamnose 3,5-epimerase